MTSQSEAYPGYATPTYRLDDNDLWRVTASPWGDAIGSVCEFGTTGWTAMSLRGRYVGLFPDQQAAGEALVKHAGYEVLR